MNTPSPTPALEAADLRFGYGRAVVVPSLSFALHPSEILAVVGANGAGKTTTALGIVGLLPQLGGRLSLNGVPIDRTKAEERAASGLILVPESRALFGGLSVEDNLLLGSYRRKPRTEMSQALDIFPILGERLKQRASSLSGGQQQMLAIGRALMSQPQVLILDEPSLGLAPLIVKQIMDVVRQLAADGLGIILIEQDLVSALEIATHGLVLERGNAILQGSPTDLMDNPAVMAAYLGGA